MTMTAFALSLESRLAETGEDEPVARIEPAQDMGSNVLVFATDIHAIDDSLVGKSLYTRPVPRVSPCPDGYVLMETHWLQNIWYAAQMLSNSDSVIDRRQGEALEKLYRMLAAATQPSEGEVP